jgi:glycosyltransferase involved in cell wall biosynthesis
MESTPTVSIVTPSYNQGDFLEKTLLSVLSQDYPKVEYIVVDGGSCDSSVDIIRKYTPRLSHCVIESDNGQADAINKGLRMAKGEILTWLNSDDLLLPGAVSKVVGTFRQCPEAGFVYGDCQVIDQNGKLIFTRRVTEYDWGVLLYGRSLISQPASFFRRSVIDQVGLLDERFGFCMDLEFWVRAAHKGIKFHMLPVPLACFRVQPSAKTARLRAKMFSEHHQILRRYSSFPWRALGPLAPYVQEGTNGLHHLRGVMQRIRQRKDFSVFQARRARRVVSAKSNK